MLAQIRKCDAATQQKEEDSGWLGESLPDEMRGPRLKTSLLLLLLLLASGLTGTAFCEGANSTTGPTQTAGRGRTNGTTGSTWSSVLSSNTNHTLTPEGVGAGGSGPADPDPEGDPGPGLLLILIPVVLAVTIIGAIVCGVVIVRRCSQSAGNHESSKEDPHLDGSSSEKVPMPMFEEDVPSVLELEMDELDQWMKKDS